MFINCVFVFLQNLKFLVLMGFSVSAFLKMKMLFEKFETIFFWILAETFTFLFSNSPIISRVCQKNGRSCVPNKTVKSDSAGMTISRGIYGFTLASACFRFLFFSRFLFLWKYGNIGVFHRKKNFFKFFGNFDFSVFNFFFFENFSKTWFSAIFQKTHCLKFFIFQTLNVFSAARVSALSPDPTTLQNTNGLIRLINRTVVTRVHDDFINTMRRRNMRRWAGFEIFKKLKNDNFWLIVSVSVSCVLYRSTELFNFPKNYEKFVKL